MIDLRSRSLIGPALALTLTAGVVGAMWLAQQRAHRRPLDPVDFVRRQTQSRLSGNPRTRQPVDKPAERAETPPEPGDNDRIKPPINEASTPPTLLQICRSSWKSIADEEIRILEESLRDQAALLSAPCAEAMELATETPIVTSYLLNCQKDLQQLSWVQIEQNCWPLLTEFRAYVSRQVYQDIGNPETLEEADLVNQIVGGMMDLKQASEESLRHTIRLADALIEQNPDSYTAYKAKLMSLLVLELKYKSPVDVTDYELLYDELLNFGSSTSINSASEDAAEDEAQEPRLLSTELDGIDPDLIHVPFLRFSALNDPESLASVAEDYITAYPNSYVGYFYLAEAAWLADDPDLAADILVRAYGEDLSERALLGLFEKIQRRPPIERIYDMDLSVEPL